MGSKIHDQLVGFETESPLGGVTLYLLHSKEEEIEDGAVVVVVV